MKKKTKRNLIHIFRIWMNSLGIKYANSENSTSSSHFIFKPIWAFSLGNFPQMPKTCEYPQIMTRYTFTIFVSVINIVIHTNVSHYFLSFLHIHSIWFASVAKTIEFFYVYLSGINILIQKKQNHFANLKNVCFSGLSEVFICYCRTLPFTFHSRI